MVWRLFRFLVLFFFLWVGGCASQNSQTHGDPLEPFNRAMFDLNTNLDKTILIPVSKTYMAITPKPARNGLRNFFQNLRSPVVLANDILQGEWARAGNTLSRFALNSTVGIGGLFDVAKAEGMERHKEDFGQTMAVTGIGPGPYLVLPILGPSSLRATIGRFPDHFFAPLTYTRFDDKNTFTTTKRVLKFTDKRSRSLQSVNKMRESAFDEYTSVRDLYWQTRASAITNGKDNLEDLPDFNVGTVQ